MSNTASLLALLPWALLTLGIWISFYLVRRYAPVLWRWPSLVHVKDDVIVWLPAGWLSGVLPLLNLAWAVWQGLPAVLVGAMVAAVRSGGDVKQAWLGAFAGAAAPLVHHLLKALPFLPYQGALPEPSPPKRPPPPSGPPAVLTSLCFALALCLGGLPACSSGLTPAQTAAQVRHDARLTYSVGTVALKTARDLYLTWANSLKAPTQAEADADLKIKAGLYATHDALAVVKSWLETGQGEPAAKSKLRDAIDGLVLLSDLLAKQGQVLPPELVTGLETARLVLGGAQ